MTITLVMYPKVIMMWKICFYGYQFNDLEFEQATSGLELWLSSSSHLQDVGIIHTIIQKMFTSLLKTILYKVVNIMHYKINHTYTQLFNAFLGLSHVSTRLIIHSTAELFSLSLKIITHKTQQTAAPKTDNSNLCATYRST